MKTISHLRKQLWKQKYTNKIDALLNEGIIFNVVIIPIVANLIHVISALESHMVLKAPATPTCSK